MVAVDVKRISHLVHQCLAVVRLVPLTSQRGRDEEVSTIFLDDGVDEVLSGWTPSQKPHAPLELRHEGHRIPDQIPPLNGCVPHLPTRKLPARERR